MKQPLFLKTADLLDAWLERFNPLQGATLGALSGYFEEADQGRFAHVMWLARKLTRRDATIRACLKRIDSTVMRLDWSVKVMAELPTGVTPQMAEAQRLYLKQRYEQIENLKQAYAFTARADFFGFAHLEKHYDTSGQVKRLEPVPQWHWCRDGLYGPWLYNAAARPWPAMSSLQPMPVADFVVREEADPWLEIALVSGLDRNQLRRDLRGFCARYGIPNTFFVAGPGSTDDDLEELNTVASAMAADGTGVLPNGADVKTHESGSKGEIFDLADRAYQSEIVMAATGGLLTMLTQSGSGTLAGGAHSDTWHELVGGIASGVAESFQEQLDKSWLAERFPGQPIAAYFSLDFPEEGANRKETAEAVKILSEAGFKAEAKWITEETGIPLFSSSPALLLPSSSLKNRFLGGPTAARDRAEAEQLVTAAVAESLAVLQSTVSPLLPDIQRLIALAEDEQATLEDFTALAQKVGGLFPEFLAPSDVQPLANRIEAALGSAAVMGARKTFRR